ncbi:MAG TPA: hybrid sensor histidine kinase/response regulator [Parvularculaceae bacterium]|nr:hybrid sensor histidine kinase/response regulator [Parvularculaceae bacterium]
MAQVDTNIFDPARILLVDDDPIMRDLAAARLREAGYQPVIAANGAEAFSLLAAEGADLVITDLDMPEMDGFELTQRIRSDKTLAETPVIVITVSDHAGAVDKAFAAGATSFLAKPINWTLFGQSVMFVLKASRDQRALRFARDQAETGARFKDGLMSIMSHELRTPLNAIIGFGQILAEQFERDHDRLHAEYAEYIVDGGKRLLNSVSDMLLASEARSGPIAFNEVDCTIGEIVTDGCDAIRKNATLSGAEIRVVLEDPGVEIRADRALLARAISKLVENAVKFSPPGVRVTVAATYAAAGLAVLVEDNGPGIPKDKLASLLQPFAQSDMSSKRSKEGLGLGLPLVRAIAAAHDVEFRLESAPGKGARALLVFPPSRLLPERRQDKRAIQH